jgi:hypothetical protein
MRFFAAAAAATAICVATPAPAAQIATYKVATWSVGVFASDRDGRFTHCAASARYQNGVTLLFSVSESLEWAIGFAGPEWNISEGRTYDVEFRIDGGRVTAINGRAVTGRLVRATLPDSAELFNQFRQGNRMVVRVGSNPEAVFNLTNTSAMLSDLLNCARKYKGHVERADNRPRTDERDTGLRNDNRNNPPPRNDPPQRNDGSSGSFSNQGTGDSRVARAPDRDRDRDTPRSQEPVSPPANMDIGPTPETRAEATQIATDILRRANFTFEFQKPEQLAGDMRDRFDVVWRSEEFLGTLRIVAGARVENIEKIRSNVIAADTASCKGKFDSGALPAADSTSVTMFTSCKGTENRSTYYILLPRRKGGVYLLGIVGNGEAAARVQNVASAYRTVALEVIEK